MSFLCFLFTGLADTPASFGLSGLDGSTRQATSDSPTVFMNIWSVATGFYILCFAFQAEADSTSFRYKEISDPYIEIIGYDGTDAEVTVPSEIDGFVVKAIGYHAFSYNKSVTKVTISDGISSVSSSAFSGCTGLRTIEIPESVSGIGNMAFAACTSLESITLPSGIKTIEDSTFLRCTKLKAVNLPLGLKKINRWAFSSCSSLESFEIPIGVTTVGEGAFDDCGNLASIKIASSVKSIGPKPFDYCPKLTKITFLGDAPEFNISASVGRDPRWLLGDEWNDRLKIWFDENKSGFTSPLWNGYPLFPLGPQIDIIHRDYYVGDTEKKMVFSMLTPGYGLDFPPQITSIKNAGSEVLKIRGIKLSGRDAKDFVVVRPDDFNLLPGEKGKLKVWFKNRQSQRSHRAKLQIFSNDSEDSPFSIDLVVRRYHSGEQ